MYILSWLLAQNIYLGLEAGVVKRWLAHYPFGRNEAETHEAIKKLRSHNSDDAIMSEIIFRLWEHPMGKKQLRLAGLIGSSIGESRDEDGGMFDGEQSPPFEAVVARRRAREDATEQRIRRRRREAIVVSDGAQPLGRDDIIQREDSFLTEHLDSERDILDTDTDPALLSSDPEVQRMIEGVRRVNADISDVHVPAWSVRMPWQQA